MTVRARLLALAAIAVVALAGCVRVTVDTTITEGETFSQHSIVAFTDAVAAQLSAQAGVDASALLDELSSSAEFSDLEERYPGQVELTEYVDGELRGIEITLTDLPIAEFNNAGRGAAPGIASASLQLTDGDYILTMGRDESLDLAQAGVTESQLELVGSNLEFAVTYTFPGLVKEATAGEVTGNTVVLGLSDLASAAEIRIVAGASTEFDWAPLLKWGGIALAFVLVVGGATALVLQDRRSRSRSALPPPEVGGEASGPGMLGPHQD